MINEYDTISSAKSLATSINEFHKKLIKVSFDGSLTCVSNLVSEMNEKRSTKAFVYGSISIVGPMKEKVGFLTITISYKIKFVNGACNCQTLYFAGSEVAIDSDSEKITSKFLLFDQYSKGISGSTSEEKREQDGIIVNRISSKFIELIYTKLQLVIYIDSRLFKVFNYDESDSFSMILPKELLKEFTYSQLDIVIRTDTSPITVQRNLNLTFGASFMTGSIVGLLDGSKPKINITTEKWKVTDMKPKVFLTYDKSFVDVTFDDGLEFEEQQIYYGNDSQKKKGLSTAAIIGISVGCAAVVIIIVVIIVYFAACRKKKVSQSSN